MMKRKIIIAVGVALLLGTLPTWAQPKARAAQEEDKSANELSVRAQTRYPHSRTQRVQCSRKTSSMTARSGT